jgi:hypothetical protein
VRMKTNAVALHLVENRTPYFIGRSLLGSFRSQSE